MDLISDSCVGVYLLFFALFIIIYLKENLMSKRAEDPRGSDRAVSQKKYYSEYRNRDPSRDRSRDDNKSKHSHSSQKSNKSNRSGPVIFGGNAIIKKS